LFFGNPKKHPQHLQEKGGTALDKQCHGEPLASNQFVIDVTTRDDKRYKSQNQMDAMASIPKPQ
jgi:hypothetical protein